MWRKMMSASTDVLEGEIVEKTKQPYAVVVRLVKERGNDIAFSYIEVLATNPKKARSAAMKIARSCYTQDEWQHISCVDLSMIDERTGEPCAKRLNSYVIDHVIPLDAKGPMNKELNIRSKEAKAQVHLLPPPAAVAEEPFNPVVITEEVLDSIADDRWKYCKKNFRKEITANT